MHDVDYLTSDFWMQKKCSAIHEANSSSLVQEHLIQTDLVCQDYVIPNYSALSNSDSRLLY